MEQPSASRRGEKSEGYGGDPEYGVDLSLHVHGRLAKRGGTKKRPDRSARPLVLPGVRTLRHGVAQDATVLSALEDALGLALQLPDPLARDVQLVTQLRERGRLAIVEAVAPDQHVAGPLRQPLDRLLELGSLHLPHHRV